MSIPFSRSMRSLDADDQRRSAAGLAVALAILALWTAWFVFSEVTLYEVTDSARLETAGVVHPIASPVSGRVVANRMVIGEPVEKGAVLAELDARPLEHELAETRKALEGLVAALAALERELASKRRAGRALEDSAQASREETRARYEKAEEAAAHAAEQAERIEQLHTQGLVSRSALDAARTEAKQLRAEAESLRVSLERIELEKRHESTTEQAQLDRLAGERARLTGEIASTEEAIERLSYEIDRRRIRAPVSGWLGEVQDLPPGSFLEEGDRLGAIVPEGDVRIVAFFSPADALGRVRPGQKGRLRLQGFPWIQYGSLSAAVARVASEPDRQRVRVELSVAASPSTSALLQHGLPGSVEIEIERVSPATLVLRAAGRLLADPRPTPAPATTAEAPR